MYLVWVGGIGLVWFGLVRWIWFGLVWLGGVRKLRRAILAGGGWRAASSRWRFPGLDIDLVWWILFGLVWFGKTGLV